MKRRDLIRLGGLAAVHGAWGGCGLLGLTGQQDGLQAPMPGRGGLAHREPGPQGSQAVGDADVTLRIAPVTVELDPAHVLSTIGYNGTAPGPLLRMKEGKPITVEVINDTDSPELVHWHGMLIPPEVDGAAEEGTPMVEPHARRRYQFTPGPAGSRWYHSHAMAMDDLHKGAYTGQFGFVYVDGGNDPGNYDQELFLSLRDWDPFFSSDMPETDDNGQPVDVLEVPSRLGRPADGLEVTSTIYSISIQPEGSPNPIRVRKGQKLLIHFLNASAIENRTIALAGHKMRVISMAGNPVPTPQLVDFLYLGAGERIDVEIEMRNSGLWIMGDTVKQVRESGMAIVVVYEGQAKQPVWIDPPNLVWDYTIFGSSTPTGPKPEQQIDMVFEKVSCGAGKFNLFHVNGKPYPHDREFILEKGVRYRLTMRNRTNDAHPLHMHRHLWELRSINDKPTAGLMKDIIVVPSAGRAVVDFTADQPGLTLFHCHIQQHMDYGFKTLFRYA